MKKIVPINGEDQAANSAWEKEQNSHIQKCPKKERAPQGLEAALEFETRAKLDVWLVENVTYAEIKKRLKSQFQLDVSLMAISRYRDRNFEKLQALSLCKTLPLPDATASPATAIIQIEGHARFTVTTDCAIPVTITPNGSGATIEIHG